MFSTPVTSSAAEEARFLRAINLNGPALAIDGRAWQGKETTNLMLKGEFFENQAVPLKPPTDAARAHMIRSSVWGSNIDEELNGLASGAYQVLVYAWENNPSERFNILVNDKAVLEGFHSGAAGNWKQLGPWLALVEEGKRLESEIKSAPEPKKRNWMVGEKHAPSDPALAHLPDGQRPERGGPGQRSQQRAARCFPPAPA